MPDKETTTMAIKPAPGQRLYSFPNGYGASVITHGYGSDQGLLELAVLDRHQRLCYDTPITNDVLGWLSEDEVQAILGQIKALPDAPA